MPGYTHLQRAIGITLGHHLLAWVEMLERDRARFAFAAAQAAPSPLGAGALAGSTLPLPPPPEPAAELARRRRRPRLRARLPLRVRDALHAPVADRRGARALDDQRVRVRTAARRRSDRLVDDAAEAESRRRRAGARQGRHGDRPADGAARDGQVAAARVQPRPAGGQAAGVRGARATWRARSARCRCSCAGLELDRGRMAAACADPLLRATDAAEQLVLEGVPFRDAHEQVAVAGAGGNVRGARRPATRLGDVAAAVAAAKERWS